jgi:hypothetical protein
MRRSRRDTALIADFIADHTQPSRARLRAAAACCSPFPVATPVRISIGSRTGVASTARLVMRIATNRLCQHADRLRHWSGRLVSIPSLPLY